MREKKGAASNELLKKTCYFRTNKPGNEVANLRSKRRFLQRFEFIVCHAIAIDTNH